MKLYATVTSERASKGQGGNTHLEVTIQGGEYRDILARFEVTPGRHAGRPFISKVIDGDRDFLLNLKSNIAFWLENQAKSQFEQVLEENGFAPKEYTEKDGNVFIGGDKEKKGERQKGKNDQGKTLYRDKQSGKVGTFSEILDEWHNE